MRLGNDNSAHTVDELGEYADSPEFIRAYTDAEGKFLWGIRVDGSIEWAKGVPMPIQNYVNRKLANFNFENIKTIQQELDNLQDDVNNFSNKVNELSTLLGKLGFSIVNDDYWLLAIKDTNNKFLFGIRENGSIEWALGVPAPIRNKILSISNEIEEFKKSIIKEINNKIDSISVNGFTIEETNYAYLIKDSENKIIAGIQKNGRVFINYLDAGNLSYLIDEIKTLKNRLGNLSTYDIEPVPYVFGICNVTSDKPRQYITSIYPEAFLNYYPAPKIKINGKRKLNLQKCSSGSKVGESGDVQDFFSSLPNVTKDKWDFEIDGEGIVPIPTTTQYIRVKNSLASGRNIFLLNIGDSTAAQTITNEDGSYEDGWCFPSACQKMAELDNIDLVKSSHNAINFKTLGHAGNVDGVTFSYRDETKILRSFREAMGGWATYCWMLSPIQVRLDFTFQSPDYQFGGEEMWYFAGLATKTPFDSEITGKEFERWTGSEEQIKEVCTTPIGRYKPDLGSNSEEYAIAGIQHLYQKFAGDNTDPDAVWDGNQEKKELFDSHYNSNLIYSQNPFYDVNKAREYTEEHIWTYNNAFSVKKWLERYRTMDDDGNRLSGSAGSEVQGQDGKSYKIGTMVTNVDDWDVCIPTHVFICLGINDNTILGDITPQQKEEMASLFEAENPNVKIGFGYLRHTGSVDQSSWQDVNVDGVVNTVGSGVYNQDKYFKDKYSELGDQRTYIPTMYTEGMRGCNSSGKALDFDTLEYVSLSTDDSIHPSLAAHYGVAYQILAWTYLTFENKENLN